MLQNFFLWLWVPVFVYHKRPSWHSWFCQSVNHEGDKASEKKHPTIIRFLTKDLSGMYTKSSIGLSWSRLNPWKFRPAGWHDFSFLSNVTWRVLPPMTAPLKDLHCLPAAEGPGMMVGYIEQNGQSSFTRNQTKIKEQHETNFWFIQTTTGRFFFGMKWGEWRITICIQVHSLSYS